MAMPHRRDRRDAAGGWSTTSYSQRSPLNHSSRSWTDNGVHYTVNTSSFSIPGISFGAMTRSTNESSYSGFMGPPRTSTRHSTGGLFGNAFSLLEDLVSMQEHHRNVPAEATNQEDGRRRVQIEVESESTGDEENHLAHARYNTRPRLRPKSVFSRIKGKILDVKSKQSSPQTSREHSPENRARAEPQRSSYRTGQRGAGWTRQCQKPPTADPEESEQQSSSSEGDYHNTQPPRSRNSDANFIEALEKAVDDQRRAVKNCKWRLEQASRQPNVSSTYLQRVVDDMKTHEMALANATSSLNKAKSEQRRNATTQQCRRTRQSVPDHRPPRPALEEHFFFTPVSFGFEQSYHMPHDVDPIFSVFEQLYGFEPSARQRDFDTYEHLFGSGVPDPASDAHFHFFAMPGARHRDDQHKRSRHSQMPPSNHNYRHSSAPNPRVYTSAPTRSPANFMKAEEAKRLFKLYTDRWANLSPLDPNVPYPARGLAASSLSARDALYAPEVSADVSTWSEETIMQANAQAFYLGVVGLTPRYWEIPGTGRVECGFNKVRALPAQVKELVDLLKKEKMRWHSDRLGRRNGGAPGQNEALQKDVRARAVFHAACELMENATA